MFVDFGALVSKSYKLIKNQVISKCSIPYHENVVLVPQ